MRDLWKIILLGIIEGVTEWLPVSSTGHLILFGEWLKPSVGGDFYFLFEILIQLGAILAVVLLYFQKLFPFSKSKTKSEKKETFRLWGKVIIALLPSAVIGFFFEDVIETRFFSPFTVACALILYGVIFIVLETVSAGHPHSAENALSLRGAVTVGAFQTLSLIPGTSRSGSTMIGGMAAGLSRTSAAEFSFFLAIPTMIGASLLKGIRFWQQGGALTGAEWGYLLLGCVVSFAVSVIVIRKLIEFVGHHTLIPFGIYRILLGSAILVRFFGK